MTSELGPDPEISSVGISTPVREADVPKCGSAVVGIFNAGICTPAREAVATPGLDPLTSGGPSIEFAANAMGILSACCGRGPNDEGDDKVEGRALPVRASAGGPFSELITCRCSVFPNEER